jgi:hypothetical protein
MVRVQVQLTEKQLSAVRRAARARGISNAAVIRELVDERLVADLDARRARALSVIGKFRSGTPNATSVDHDAALDEIYGTW